MAHVRADGPSVLPARFSTLRSADRAAAGGEEARGEAVQRPPGATVATPRGVATVAGMDSLPLRHEVC